MTEKFKKINKPFCLSDSSKNSYRYRLLTSGYLLDEFAKNPIGYYMHGTEEFPREAGVLVKWEDLRLDDDKVWGTPCINLNHPRGQRTVEEIESGFLNAASFGHFVVLDAEMECGRQMQDGDMEGLVVTKWYNRECSLVDIPGNYNALTPVLYDANDNELTSLSDFSTKYFNMKQLQLSATQLAVILTTLNLKAEADGAEFDKAFANLAAEAQKVPDLTAKLTAANANLIAMQKDVNAGKVASLIESGLKAGKFTKLASDKLAADYAENPDGLKALVDALPAYQGIVAKIGEGTDTDSLELKDLMAKDYATLDKEGTLGRLKDLSADGFKAKFKARFGVDYTGH